jgi:hypothetical protein
MFEGRIVGVLNAASVTVEKLGLMISGIPLANAAPVPGQGEKS